MLTTGLVPSRPVAAIHRMVLLESNACRPQLVLEALNPELSVRLRLPTMNAMGALRTCLPGLLLNALVRQLPAGSISLTQADHGAATEVAWASGQALVDGLSADEWPSLPVAPAEAEPLLTLPAAEFVQLVRAVVHAAADDHTQPTLMGVLFEIEATTLTAVSVDGHRLAMCQTALATPSLEPLAVILPAGALTTAAAILAANPDTDVSLTAGAQTTSVLLQTPTCDISMRVIDGAFPDYMRFLPTTTPHRCSVDRAALQSMIARTALFAAGLTLVLTFGAESLTVAAQSTAHGRVSEMLPATGCGPTLVIAVNADYLAAALATLDHDQIVLASAGRRAPLLIHGHDDETTLQLVMPLALSDAMIAAVTG